jgi:hypothetical protein
MEVQYYFVIIIALIITLKCLVFVLDKIRIRTYLTARGDVPLSITWKIFGKGWLGESQKEGAGNRIYKLHFVDIIGNETSAWCKTAMFSGVYLADELITKEADLPTVDKEDEIAHLEKQLAKLKAES